MKLINLLDEYMIKNYIKSENIISILIFKELKCIHSSVSITNKLIDLLTIDKQDITNDYKIVIYLNNNIVKIYKLNY